MSSASLRSSLPTVHSCKPQPPPAGGYSALNLREERNALRDTGSREGQQSQLAAPRLPLSTLSHAAYRPKSPEGPGGCLWRAAVQTGQLLPAHPSITPFNQGAKGLNFSCSTKGYFSGLQVLVWCEYAERSQECKCIDVVPTRP